MQRFSDWLKVYDGPDRRFGRLVLMAARDPGWPAHAGYAELRRYIVGLGAGDAALDDLARGWLAYPGDPASSRAADDDADKADALWAWYGEEAAL